MEESSITLDIQYTYFRLEKFDEGPLLGRSSRRHADDVGTAADFE